MKCNCESSYCVHHNPDDDTCAPCTREADGTLRMDYVGIVCETCANVTRLTGAPDLIHPVEVETI